MKAVNEEIFDIYDEQGNPIGTAARSEVHAAGYWHRTFHCWLVRVGEDGGARVLFQRRSDDKDTNPGRYDITAAGHLAAGETIEDAVREMDEELGLAVSFEELVPYGTVREESVGEVHGRRYIDREVSHVFGFVTDRPPRLFELQPEEVAGLYEADARQLLDLMEGRTANVQAEGIRLRNGRAESDLADVRVSDFVPRDLSYYVEVIDFLQKLALNGRG